MPTVGSFGYIIPGSATTFFFPVALRTIIFYYVRFSIIQKGPPFLLKVADFQGLYNGSFWLVGIINSLLVSINQDAMGWHRSVSEVLHLRIHVRGAIICDLFGMVKCPFQRVNDLQLGDQQVTLNHLVYIFTLSTTSWGQTN